jgi:hypothetical protein
VGNAPPRAPAGPGDQGKRLWCDVVGKYLLDPAELAVLDQLCHTIDELGRLNPTAGATR